jgi:hypothetical protein
MVITYRHFGTTIGPILRVPIGCPETSVRSYLYSLLKTPEYYSFPMTIDYIYKSTANDY